MQTEPMDVVELASREEKVIQQFVKLWKKEIENDPGMLINLLFETAEMKAYLYNRKLIDECDKWIADHGIKAAMARERRGN